MCVFLTIILIEGPLPDSLPILQFVHLPVSQLNPHIQYQPIGLQVGGVAMAWLPAPVFIDLSWRNILITRSLLWNLTHPSEGGKQNSI